MIQRIWCEVSIQQVRGNRQIMLGVRRDLEAPLMLCLDAVLLHQPFYPFLAGRESAQPELPDHARTAVRALEFDMDGLNQRQHLRIRQTFPLFPLRVAPTLP